MQISGKKRIFKSYVIRQCFLPKLSVNKEMQKLRRTCLSDFYTFNTPYCLQIALCNYLHQLCFLYMSNNQVMHLLSEREGGSKHEWNYVLH